MKAAHPAKANATSRRPSCRPKIKVGDGVNLTNPGSVAEIVLVLALRLISTIMARQRNL